MLARLPKKPLSLPSWWRKLHPRGTARFWRSVEMLRQELGVNRWDQDAVAAIVDRMKEKDNGRYY